jgi:hypothetical protein
MGTGGGWCDGGFQLSEALGRNNGVFSVPCRQRRRVPQTLVDRLRSLAVIHPCRRPFRSWPGANSLQSRRWAHPGCDQPE